MLLERLGDRASLLHEPCLLSDELGPRSLSGEPYQRGVGSDNTGSFCKESDIFILLREEPLVNNIYVGNSSTVVGGKRTRSLESD